MKIKETELRKFSQPYYKDKDIMHDMWHIELVKRQLDKLIEQYNYVVDYDCLIAALYFHGFIYSHQAEIENWLKGQGADKAEIEKIVRISWESQRPEAPETFEGRLLHDAHILEGGKTYTAVKTLITGSVRGQTLTETLDFMRNNVLGANRCYLPETSVLCDEMNKYTEQFYEELMKGIT